MVRTSRATQPFVAAGVSVTSTSTGVSNLPLTFCGLRAVATIPIRPPSPPVSVVTFVPDDWLPLCSDVSVNVWFGLGLD